MFPARPILIVDDDRATAAAIELSMKAGGFTNTLVCTDSRTVERLLTETPVEAVLLDLTMPYITGETLLERITVRFPHVPVIIVTGTSELDSTSNCIHNGAFDYLVKPISREQLIATVRKAVQSRLLQNETKHDTRRTKRLSCILPDAFNCFHTRSQQMLTELEKASTAACTLEPVLISGATGTGKSLMAHAIHKASGCAGPLLEVHVASLDAAARSGDPVAALHDCLAECGDGCSALIDDIAEVNQKIQDELLAVIRGENRPWRVRLIATTRYTLEFLEGSGRFRTDLLKKLMTNHIRMPTLKERTADMPLLVDRLLREACEKRNKKRLAPPPGLLALLNACDFKDNVQGLRNLVEAAVNAHQSGPLGMSVFHERTRQNQASHGQAR